QNYSVLIKDQLQGKNVGIISTTENYDYTQDISKTITDANGSVAYDIVLKSGLTNKDKIKELDSELQLQLKTEKDVVN
ncbi:copper transporter, partial [Casaltella massiliensis]|nr:copper transporter [Casaltella massiliensis]